MPWARCRRVGRVPGATWALQNLIVASRFKEVPERFIKFNLMVLTHCEPTSTPHELALILNSSWSFLGVEHLGKSRFRTIRGLGPPCRFISATRRLGGHGKFAH